MTIAECLRSISFNDSDSTTSICLRIIKEYGYQSTKQICVARGNHPQGKKTRWHYLEGDSKQMVGFRH